MVLIENTNITMLTMIKMTNITMLQTANSELSNKSKQQNQHPPLQPSPLTGKPKKIMFCPHLEANQQKIIIRATKQLSSSSPRPSTIQRWQTT